MVDRFQIRPAVASDLSGVVALEDLVFPNPWDASAFPDLLAAVFLVAVDPDQTVIGYGIGRAVADEGEILNLAVAPTVRRRGVGTGLLESLLAHLASAGAEHVYLEVRASNLAAVGLYRRHGFQVVGERHRYYRQPPENALVMRRATPP